MSALPEANRAGSGEVDVPALRQARLSAGVHRVVRRVFAPGPTEGSAPGLRELRRVTPPRWARPMRALLATPSRPAFRAW